VIVQARLEGKVYVLDASKKFHPFGLLPTDDLNEKGFLLYDGEGRHEIADIPASKVPSMAVCKTEMSLNGAGDLSCCATISFEGYHNVEERGLFESDSEKNYFDKKIKDLLSGAVIDSFKVANRGDIEAPFGGTAFFRLAGHAQATGERIYFVPPLLVHLEPSPFVKEERAYPVEYYFADGFSEEITISIPPGFTVSELPEAVYIRDVGLSFSSGSKLDGDKIKYFRTFTRNQNLYKPMDYESLRRFLTQIESSEQGTTVLEKGAGAI
jgi:hypothetical protein